MVTVLVTIIKMYTLLDIFSCTRCQINGRKRAQEGKERKCPILVKEWNAKKERKPAGVLRQEDVQTKMVR